jgi:hypothetical protein
MHQNSSETPPAAAAPPPQSFVTSKADDDRRASLFSPNRETKTKVLLADYHSQRGIDSRQSKKKSSSRATGVLLLLLLLLRRFGCKTDRRRNFGCTFFLTLPSQETETRRSSNNNNNNNNNKSPGPGTRSCDDRDLACDSKFARKDTTPGKHHLESNITNICDRGRLWDPYKGRERN